MKVSDVMQRSVIRATPLDPIKDVARLIFSLGISGVPVVENEKLVGIITEEDLFNKVYPLLPNFKTDVQNPAKIEKAEKDMNKILATPIKKVMNKRVFSISSNTELLDAQNIMLSSHFSRIPVVNAENELIGIVTQGDIFREILKTEIPEIEENRYADFVSHHYDDTVDWDRRLKNELPTILDEFEKYKIESVLDVGTWTGEYPIALATCGVKRIVGVDHNPSMIDISNSKLKKANSANSKKIDFILTNFEDIGEKISETFDAALCIGNALPYIPLHIKSLFPHIAFLLRKKNPVIIIQLLNLDKIIKKNERLLSFGVSKTDAGKEHMFFEFFDNAPNSGKLLHHVVTFDNDGTSWIFKGITTVPIFHYTKSDVESALRASGFDKIYISGNDAENPGEYGRLSFAQDFDSLTSDWLNIIAVKKQNNPK